MRIVYLGTPDFAVKPLEKLVENGYEVVAVVTNLDKKVGRKQILTACPVKETALNYGIPVLQYEKIRYSGVEDLKNLKPDLMITCAFGQILSQEILDIPKYGVINIHASLLPKYRGASPIHYAILNGETETGITIMKTDVGIDTGDIILQKSIKINENETCGELFDRLSILGAECIVDGINAVINNERSIVQDNNTATYTKIIKKEDALINFNVEAKDVVNQIRAFNPSPICYAFYNANMIKVYKATISNGFGKPGEIIDNKNCLEIACKNGSIKIETIQKAGGKPLNIQDFLRGNSFVLGECLKND